MLSFKWGAKQQQYKAVATADPDADAWVTRHTPALLSGGVALALGTALVGSYSHLLSRFVACRSLSLSQLKL